MTNERTQDAGSDNSTLDFLQGMTLFHDLRREELANLARLVSERRYAKGSVIFTQDSLGGVAFMVQSGRVGIVLDSADGRELIVHEILPGDYFGEMALLDGQRRSASAVTLEDTTLLVLPGKSLLAELERHPTIMLRMLQAMSRRLRLADQNIGKLAFSDVGSRLAGTLLELSGGGTKITATHEDLANRIGAARQTVNKVLNRWQRQGYLRTARGSITILDRRALERQREGLIDATT